MRLTAGVILASVLVSTPSARAQDISRPTGSTRGETSGRAASAEIDDYVRGVMQKRHIPGVSIAVVRGGEVVLTKGYGQANVELGVPATADTVYQLASVTKTFTATAIMLLVKDGKIALDDKITARLADLPKTWEDVTVRHLLNHTSGIKSYTSVKGFEKTMRKDYAQREIIDLVAKEPLEFKPGEKWNYSNTGYFLLGMLIEKSGGKPYGEFMADRIFKPLGMTKTRANDLRAIIPGRAQGYEWNGKELRNGEYTSPTQPFAAGMLVSTVADMVKWDAALAGRTLLDASTLARMWKPTPLAKGEAGYGFGWGVEKANGRRLVSHGGGIPGFSSQISRFLDDDLTVIVLSNAEGGHAGSLARGIAGLLVPTLKEKAAAPMADKDGKTTDRHRIMLEAALKGEADPDLFGDEAKDVLIPNIKALKPQLTPLGALTKFELIERKERGDALQLRYRAVLEKATLKVLVVLDKSGKIAGLLLQPED